MGALVGRQREIERLTAALDAAQRGAGELVLLVGEAGIGKTALASEIERVASARGVRWAFARGWDGAGAPAFWPFTQIVRALARDRQAPASLARLVPELAAPSDATPPSFDARARFALFDAVASWLRDVAEEKPLAIVLDDLHAVDPSSLSMLEFVAREAKRARVLLVGAYRDHALDAGPEALDGLARIAREGTLLRLPRLAREDVRTLVDRAAGPAAPAIAELVYRTSEGVPLFVEEILRSLGAPGSAWLSGAPIPSGVRSVIRERLVRLDEETLRLLEMASVIGTTFTLGLVGLLSSADAARVHELVEGAVRAAVVERCAPGRYAFTHGMVREALYREIPGGRRAQLHATVTRALESHAGEASLAERAYHALRAAPVIGVGCAVAAAREAASAAMQAQAFEDAAELLRRALAVLDVAVASPALREEVRAALAAARAPAAERAAPEASPRPKRRLSIARDGELWVVRFGDLVARLKDSRGVQMLATLVERAGEEVHAVALCAAPGADVAVGDAGEVLDRDAILAYRERAGEVEEELREAEAWNDGARMARARSELEILRSELSRAVGLGGRARRAGSDAERARVNAQRRIRDAVRRIAEQDPELGRYVARSIRTGTFCAYVPLDVDGFDADA